MLPYDASAENICRFVADHLATKAADMLWERRIHTIRVRVSETETCWSEYERSL